MPASLDEILTRLKRRYADVRRLGPKDPFEQVLYECACYLVDDARREEGARLVSELACASTAPALARELGLPPAAIARSQARHARQALWAA